MSAPDITPVATNAQTHSPSVSLLIPCYNAAPFLPQLAAEIKASIIPFSEIVCYDDGSTDDTATLANSFGWRVITPNPNRGVAHARNQLVKAARSEWVHFHDADDPLSPHFLERLQPHCAASVDAVSCNADWVDAQQPERVQIEWRYSAAALAKDPYRTLITHAMALTTVIVRRDTWIASGGCDETLKIWEDADVNIRIARAGARWRHIPEVLSVSHRRPESFSHDYRLGWRCRLAALEKYAAHTSASLVQWELAAEAEQATRELLKLNDLPSARSALALSQKLGARPPTTNNLLLKTAKLFLPPLLLMRWQNRHRTPSS